MCRISRCSLSSLATVKCIELISARICSLPGWASGRMVIGSFGCPETEFLRSSIVGGTSAHLPETAIRLLRGNGCPWFRIARFWCRNWPRARQLSRLRLTELGASGQAHPQLAASVAFALRAQGFRFVTVRTRDTNRMGTQLQRMPDACINPNAARTSMQRTIWSGTRGQGRGWAPTHLLPMAPPIRTVRRLSGLLLGIYGTRSVQPYSAYFLDVDGTLALVEPIYAATDTEALTVARARLATSRHAAVEVRQSVNRIARIERGPG